MLLFVVIMKNMYFFQFNG